MPVAKKAHKAKSSRVDDDYYVKPSSVGNNKKQSNLYVVLNLPPRPKLVGWYTPTCA